MVSFFSRLKQIAGFDIRKFTTSPVKTGVLPIGGIGSTGVRLAGVTKRFGLGVLRLAKPTTFKGAVGLAVGVPTLVGVLATSPTARGIAKGIFDPRKAFGRGKGLGAIVEDPSKLIPEKETVVGVGEKVRDIAREAGLAAAAGAALTGAAVITAKKVRERLTKAPQLPPTALLPTPITITTIPQPLGPVERPAPKEVAMEPLTKPVSIKVINKPEINISFRKSRKFINQQLLIR